MNLIQSFFSKKILSLLLLMEVWRLIQLFINPFIYDGVSRFELFSGMIMGLRFDVLVMGFVLIPATVLSWVLPLSMTWVLRIYFLIFWLLSSALYIIDDCWLTTKRFRFNHSHWHEFFDLPFHFSLSHICIVIGTGIGVFVLCKGYPQKKLSKTSPLLWLNQGVRFFLSPLIVALMARGTLTQHHLRWQHAQISQSPVFNDWVLSPLWTLDKNF